MPIGGGPPPHSPPRPRSQTDGALARTHHRARARKRTVPAHAPTNAPSLALATNGSLACTHHHAFARARRCAHAPHSLASPAIVLRSPALATDGALACTHHHPVPAVSYSPSAPRRNPIRATTPFQFLNFSVSDLT